MVRFFSFENNMEAKTFVTQKQTVLYHSLSVSVDVVVVVCRFFLVYGLRRKLLFPHLIFRF